MLVWCGKSSTESVKLYLSSTHGTPSKSDVAPVSLHSMASEAGLTDAHLRDGPLQNLWREGRAKYQKKYLRKGKLNEKNSCTPINPKKYLCYGLKKIHTRNLITKKIPAARKFPSPPPITFLMVRPLSRFCPGRSFVRGPIEDCPSRTKFVKSR